MIPPSLFLRLLFFILFIICISISSSEAALYTVKNAARTLLDMDGVSDLCLKSIFLFFATFFQYLTFSAIFEYTNPAPKTEKRMREIRNEIKLGVGATIVNAGFAALWLYFIDHHTPYYGYYENRPYTLKNFAIGLLVYFFWTDTWFYWTHRLLHLKYFWKRVHYLHHSFLEPTAFAQDAVHPFEAFIQGPCGHFSAGLFYPLHPIMMAVVGFFTAAYAIAAHDGRALDLNNHQKHHTHRLGKTTTYEIVGVNFGLWSGFWDYICGTRYSENKCVAWNPVKDEEVLMLKQVDKMLGNKTD